MWRNHKSKIAGAAGVIGLAGMIGPTATAVLIASVIGGIGVAFWRKSTKEKRLLEPLWKEALEKNRKAIEEMIGPFEVPENGEMVFDSGEVVEDNGKRTPVIRNVLYLKGKWGMAFIRVLGTDDDPPLLRKLSLNLTSYKEQKTNELTLVENKPKHVIVDSPKFKIFTWSEHNEKMKSVRRERIKKMEEEYERMYLNKKKQASSL